MTQRAIIVPAIDIIEGKCVRLTRGDYSKKKVYNERPLEVAKQLEDIGAQHLHVVDLDGAKAGHIINWKVLEQLTTKTNLAVDFGGGVKNNKDLEIAFECGVQHVTGGSIAVKNRPLFMEWFDRYGANKIVLGADVKDRQIQISGWQEDTGIDLFDYLKVFYDKGFSYVICTDIDKDGLLQGTAIELYKEIIERFPKFRLIASGGVSSVDDVYRLDEAGLYGIIIGKAIYEGRITVDQLKNLFKERN